MKLKQSNIFDYWAPTDGKTKIADFGKNTTIITNSINTNKNIISDVNSNPIISTNNSQDTSLIESKNNTWFWISLIGGVILIGGIYLLNRYKIKEKENKRNI